MPAPKYDRETIERAVSLREGGASYRQIAEKLGMSRGSVRWHCLKLGAEHPVDRAKIPTLNEKVIKRGTHTLRRFTPDEDEKMTELHMGGVRICEIAKALDRPHNSVIGRLMTIARHEALRERGDQV